MTTRLLERTAWIPAPPEKVFDFFSAAENLQQLTPDWLHFRILTPLPVFMEKGTRIDYQIGLYGVPMKWKTEITAWEPPRRFEDTQLAGPYRVWIHEHIFEPESGGTRMTDRVRYRARGALFEPLVNRFFVRRSLARIFDFRESRLAGFFREPGGDR